jgi:hypothetical protein
MLLVMQALAQLLVCSAALVCHRHWTLLIVVSALLVLHLMSRVLVCCLMGDSLH